MAELREAVIASAVRTPIGRFLGALSSLTAPQLGAAAIKSALQRAELPADAVDQVVMGCVVQAGMGQAPARQAAIHAGIPDTVPAVTVNKVCGSGLFAVMQAAQAVKLGDDNIVVAGGMESMSNVPYYLKGARTGLRMGDSKLIDGVIHDGLWCAFEDQHMGCAAEWVAQEFGIERTAMDEFSLRSHQLAIQAHEGGRFGNELVSIEVPGRKGITVVDRDEGPRADTSLDALGKLRAAFVKEGRVTAGNAPGLSDGAAAIVVTSPEVAQRRGMPVLARITGYSAAGIEPKAIFAAPPRAIRKLAERTGFDVKEFDLIELNEAFAAQVLANVKELGVDPERVNVNGGAIALGHPIGASGARVLATLIWALKARNLTRGLAALCLGGGEAVAMSIEVV